LFDRFWRFVKHSLRPGGRVFFVDSRREPTSTAVDHAPLTGSGVVRRKLNDGREFQIVKVFYDPDDLRRRLDALGWDADVHTTGSYFLYGTVKART
jgi:hypothetical protein